MTSLPLPEEFVGNSVTESQFKDALVRLITGITAYLDERGVEIDTSLNNALGTFLNIVQRYSDDIDNRILHHPFNDEVLFQFADAEGNVVFQINTDGSFRIVQLEKSLQETLLELLSVNNNFTLDDSMENVLLLIDADENVILKINKLGELFIPNLNNSVQQEFNNLKQLTDTDDSENVATLLDNDGNIVLLVDNNGRYFIPGLDTDIATAIESKSAVTVEMDTSNLANYSYRDTFIPKAQNLLNFFRNNHNVGLLAPVPLQSFEQNFSIGTAWINQANIAEWGDYIPVRTPYGSDRGVVHPHILEFPNKFMGCRYILAITGYTNGRTQEENPFLLGSNDLQSFELLTPVLDEPASYTWEKGIVYNSDPFMFYDIKTGELCLIFREYWADTSGVSPSQTHEFLYIRRTKDGNSWSERELMWGAQSGTLMSPAVIYDVRTETYHMYAVGRSNGSAYGLIHLTSKTLKNDWEVVGLITPPSDSSVWHVDVKIIGDKQVLTFQNRVGSTSVGFKTGIASDFHNFTWADNWWNPLTYEIYKASFLPQFNEQNEMRLVYVWTTNHKPTSPLKYKLFVQATPFLNVDFLEK